MNTTGTPAPRRLAVRVGVAIAAVLGVVGVGHAAIPGGDGRIKGCYEGDSAGTGSVLKDLYVVDERDSCPTGTTELLWGQLGPSGPAGAQGPAGPTGAAGPAGAPEPRHGTYLTDVRQITRSLDISGRFGGSVVVYCDRQETAIAGGWEFDYPPNDIFNTHTMRTSREVHGGENVKAEWFSSEALESRGEAVRTPSGWQFSYQWLPLLRKRPGVAHLGLSVSCARTIVTSVPPLPTATGKKFGPRP